MPIKKKNSNGNGKGTKEHTLKDASSELDISEATVKKYLKDFDLEIIKSGNKPAISEETFQALSEIVKLRANGLSIQEIKELKSQEPSKTALDELNEEESKPVPVSTDESEKSEMPVEIELGSDVKEESDTEYSELKESKEDEEKEAKPEGDIENGQGEQIEQEEQEEQGEQAESLGGPRRRRLFNYRYVERQISNDTKKISWLRQRIKSPNVSTQDKLLFEESLERRIMFLDGWKHILRWVSSK